MHARPHPPPANGRGPVLAWALYDWGNSAFATTVMAGFFPLFFKQFWSAGTDAAVSTARLGLANSLAGLGVALAAPVLGAMADRGSARKRFLLTFAALGIISTAALPLVASGHWQLAALLYVLATIGFSGGNVFYDALITAVTSEELLERVSSLGYALGYLGGGLLFALNVWMTLSPATFGLADASQAVRLAFVTVGLWWGLFSVPLVLWVREPPRRAGPARRRLVREGLAQLRQTLGEIRGNRPIVFFLLAYWLYIDGVDTVVRMAVDYGLSLGFDAGDLITALLITQFVGFPAALVFGRLGERIGARRAIYIALTVYVGVTFWGAFIRGPREFYALAATIGLVQGGIQALSRSFFARLIPADKSAQYFGFYNMMGKFAAVLGPALLGAVALSMRAFGLPGTLASRISLTSLTLLFVGGGLLLWRVRP